MSVLNPGERVRAWRGAREKSYTAPLLHFPPDLPLGGMDLLIGLIYIGSGGKRVSNSSLQIARELLTFLPGTVAIRVWGILFFILGVVLCIAIYHRVQGLISFVRIVGASLFFMWAGMYFLSGLANDTASFIGVPVFLYLSYRHSFAPVRIDASVQETLTDGGN